MSGFRFEAIDSAGHLHRGVMEADTPRQVRAKLREQGLIAAQVDSLSEPAAHAERGGWRLRRGMSTSQLSLLTRQFATLLGAGLPIEQSLDALIEQAETQYVRQVLAGVRSEVLAGQSLARAMEKYPAVFPDIYRTLVHSGEQSGRLSDVLLRLAEYTEARHALKQKVGLAFVYPAIVTVVAVSVVLGLLTYVVPQVVSVFQNTHQALPWLTRALIATSDFLRSTGLLWLAAMVVGA